jgi:hypothetical protein
MKLRGDYRKNLPPLIKGTFQSRSEAGDPFINPGIIIELQQYIYLTQ